MSKPDRAHRDGVLLLQLQVPVEPELEVVTVGDQHDRVLVGELRLGDLRLEDPDGRAHRAVHARHGERLRDPLLERGGPHPAALLLLHLLERGEVDLGVAGGPVQLAVSTRLTSSLDGVVE